jgi:hypothetical protein
MSRFRTSIVAFVTLAVAVFPLAGVSAQGVSPEGPLGSAQHVSAQHDSVQADCEKHAKMGQSKSDQGHCGKLGGCGKCLCLGLTAVLAPAPDTRMAPPPAVKTARIAVSAESPAYIPPSPPPRI